MLPVDWLLGWLVQRDGGAVRNVLVEREREESRGERYITGEKGGGTMSRAGFKGETALTQFLPS